jgi:hypothetical protein
MATELYVRLQNPIKRADSSSLDELEVSIDHCKGGYNFSYGYRVESGVKVFFTPVHRERNCISATLLGNFVESGFKTHVLDAKRKSQKKIDMVANAIKPLLEKFGEIWGQPDFEHTIPKMVIDATENLRK